MPQLSEVRLNGGEVEESYSTVVVGGRTVSAGLRTCLNFLPQRGGRAYKRPGFEFTHLHEDGGASTVPRFILRPIVASGTGYLAMIGAGFIKMLDADGEWIVRGSESTHDWTTGDFTAGSEANTWYVTPPDDLANVAYPYRVFADGVEQEFVTATAGFQETDLASGQWTVTDNASGVKFSSPRVYMDFGGTPSGVRFDYRVYLYADYTESTLRALDDGDSGFTKVITNKGYQPGALVRTSMGDADWFWASADFDVASENTWSRLLGANVTYLYASVTKESTYYQYGLSWIDNDGVEGPVSVIDAGFGPDAQSASGKPGFTLAGFNELYTASPAVRTEPDVDQWVIPATTSGSGYKWVQMSSFGLTGTTHDGAAVADVWILLEEDSAESWSGPLPLVDSRNSPIKLGRPPTTIRNPTRPLIGEVGSGNTITRATEDDEWPLAGEFVWYDAYFHFRMGRDVSNDSTGTIPSLSWAQFFQNQDALVVNTSGLAVTDPNDAIVKIDFPKNSGWRVYRRLAVDTSGATDPRIRDLLWGDWGLLAEGFVVADFFSTEDDYDNYGDYPFAGVPSSATPNFPPTDDLVISGKYPHRVAVHAERMALAGGEDSPSLLRHGRRGVLFDFGEASTSDALAPFTRELASETDIEFIVSATNLIAFTSQEYFRVWSSTGVIADETVTVDRNADLGVLPNCKPVRVGSAIVFVNNTGDSAYMLVYQDARKGYVPIPLSDLASHIFKNQTPYEGAYHGDPFRYVWWATDQKFELPVLLVSPEEEVAGWARARVRESDEVFTVASLPRSSGRASLFAGVMRPSDEGGEILTVERLSEYEDDERLERYLDGHTFFGAAPSTIANAQGFGAGQPIVLDVPDLPIPFASSEHVTILKLKVVVNGEVLVDLENYSCYALGSVAQKWLLYEDAGLTTPIEVASTFDVDNDSEDPYSDDTYEYPWEAGIALETLTGLDHLADLTVAISVNGEELGFGAVDSSGEVDARGDAPFKTTAYPIWAYVGFGYPTELETYDLSQNTEELKGRTMTPSGVRIHTLDTKSLLVGVNGGPMSYQKRVRRTEEWHRSLNDRLDYIDAKPATDSERGLSVRIRQDLPVPCKIAGITTVFEVDE